MYTSTLGYCDNCTTVKVNGVKISNNNTLWINAGDDIILEAGNPRVFNVSTFRLRFNGSTSLLPKNCHHQMDTLKYNCSNSTTDNTGVYITHIFLHVNLPGNHPEWCSNNVTICKAQNNIENR